MIPTESELLKALDDLGNEPDMIAQSLHAMGIKGSKEHSNTCPIARFLVTTFEEAASVDHDDVVVYKRLGWEFSSVLTPTVIAKFITAFDSNKYPSLIE